VNLKLTRISYQYELDREGSGLETTAEEWITDKYGLTKKQDKLSKYSGKFRRKTIDRKDYIFDKIKAALNV
jgi:colicin import membrane protein